MTTATPRDDGRPRTARMMKPVTVRGSEPTDPPEAYARANDDVITEWLESLPDDAEDLPRVLHQHD